MIVNEKIGRYTEDEILEHLTEGEGRSFLGRSMYDAIFDKIHALKTENEQLKQENARLKDKIEKTKQFYTRELLKRENLQTPMKMSWESVEMFNILDGNI